jgi:hypothetical protein
MSKPKPSGTSRVEPVAVAFFYEHAGYSYDPKVETKEQGRQRCAEQLAYAESTARELGLSFEWDVSDINSSEFSDKRPSWDLYDCVCRDREGKVVTSLGGCDFGEDADGPYGHYRRVVEAELAAEAIALANKVLEDVLGPPVRPSMPNREQLKALIHWAEQRPRFWKAALDAAWLKAGAGVPGYNPYLQQVRNEFGPSWLQSVTLKQLKAAYEESNRDPVHTTPR